MIMDIKNYVWALPFFSFIAGSLVIQHISNIAQLEAPAIVGTQIQTAVVKLSEKNLNLRILAQKEDLDLPEGTILSQTPSSGQKIKPHQAIHIVISKKPKKIAAPYLIGKPNNMVKKELEDLSIRGKSYLIPSNKPTQSCIAQFPSPGTQLEENKIIIYLSDENHKPVLMPDFRGKKLSEVTTFLDTYNIDTKITQAKKSKKISFLPDSQEDLITDQRPLAGSIINLSDKKILVQLQVSYCP